jgi:DNA recombination protein RmuC
MDVAQLVLLGVVVVLLLWLALRRDGRGVEDLERNLRADVQDSARATRQELTATLATFQQSLLAQSSDVARTQNEQIDSFRTQLATMQQRVSDDTRAAREAQDAALHRFGQAQAEQLRALGDANDKRLAEVRQVVEAKLTQIQADNGQRLEQMRATVDEKLSATLEQRLGESFKQVAERLEQVHKGLGEMQTLARDVGSLSRTLAGVKNRGVFGEVQLGALLADVFTPDQYATNVETVPGSRERVEFAVRLPGRGGPGADEAPLWLPIDAKFPREDYERLLDAQERADKDGADAAGKAIEARLKAEARTIRDKYIAAPHTTDFGILFVPTEGLYAEALRRPGLVDALQREHRVVLAGPTTLMAMLNSLQMGFRTLALEKRSAEVWQVLGAVKTEFGKFGDVLARTRDKIDAVSKSIEAAEVRTRAMARQLRSVEALPAERVPGLLGLDLPDDEEPGPR